MREAARGGERGIAVAGRHVEHALAGANVHGFGKRLADDLQRRANDREVAAGPGGLLALLDGFEIRLGRVNGTPRGRLMLHCFHDCPSRKKC